MKTKDLKFTFIVALVATTLFACNSSKNKQGQSAFADNHTAQNSLDWVGTYSGNLPCADCEYIETELTLTEDMNYVLTSIYMRGEPLLVDTLTGTFTWQGNNVKLEGIPQSERPALFKVEENQLRQLDLEGNEITSELASHYVIRKHGNASIEDKRWQLVELNGQPIQGAADTHYLIFHSEAGQLEAKADCNVLLNDYTIKNDLQLKITPGISTLMACPDNLEQDFLAMLFLADNMSTDGNTLTLNKARMAPLAKFELVK